MEQLDQAVLGNLRNMARQGRSPSQMLRELKRHLGADTHIVTLLDYFRQAFCLTLAEAKPLAALTRNEQREVENEADLDELLLPAIVKHQSDWECSES
jgi:hypothetical protein